MPKNKRATLTTPDLVLLSLLAERPMHGYQANAELERREWRDWVDISRPQLYYSMEKLARTGMIAVADTDEPSGGPDRRVFATTAKGRAALASALEREDWSAQRDRPAFLTWLALSWQARPGVVARQLARRKEFLQAAASQRAIHSSRRPPRSRPPLPRSRMDDRTNDRPIPHRVALAQQGCARTPPPRPSPPPLLRLLNVLLFVFCRCHPESHPRSLRMR